MRILLLSDRIPPEARGGAETVVWRLAKGLACAGHDIHVVAATAGSPFDEVRDGIPTYHLHASYPDRFRAWLSLRNPQTTVPFRRLLERLRPDVVNAHNIHFALSYHCLRLAREAGCGVVFSAHDAMPFAYGKLMLDAAEPSARDLRLPPGYNLRRSRLRYNPLRNLLIRRQLRHNAHARSAPSHALAAAFAANDMPPVTVAHNGIDIAEWRLVAPAVVDRLRSRLDLSERRVVLIAGRLTREKGLRPMLEALDRLRESVPAACLLVLSARELEAGLSAEFAHLHSWIRLGGWLAGDELRAAFQLADVVAIPSIYLDPFPTVALEAMAAANPVIATCFGGAREAVVDGETGFIINPHDSSQFSSQLRRVLQDGGLRRELGARGQERVAAKFSLEAQASKMLQLYERAIAAAKAES